MDVDWALTMMLGTVGLVENWRLRSMPSRCARAGQESRAHGQERISKWNRTVRDQVPAACDICPFIPKFVRLLHSWRVLWFPCGGSGQRTQLPTNPVFPPEMLQPFVLNGKWAWKHSIRRVRTDVAMSRQDQ